MLLMGAAVTLGVMVMEGGTEKSLLSGGLIPAAVLAACKMLGSGIGGADIIAALLTGAVMGTFGTFRILLMASFLFLTFYRKDGEAYLPWLFAGYIAELFLRL